MDGEKVAVCLTLAVYRGSVVRKQGEKQGQIRVSRAVPGPLPSTCAKVVHAAVLERERQDSKDWVTSVLSQPVVLERTSILGEIVPLCVQASESRLHLRFSKAAEQALGVAQRTGAQGQ